MNNNSLSENFFSPTGPFFQDRTVLIVDDMPMMRSLVKQALSTLGFKIVHEAGDGRSAWDYLSHNENIQLVISDFNMPKMNGLELLENTRNNNKTKTLPFVILTTQNEEEIILRAIELKANNFITKPFVNDDFRKKLLYVANQLSKSNLQKSAS